MKLELVGEIDPNTGVNSRLLHRTANLMEQAGKPRSQPQVGFNMTDYVLKRRGDNKHIPDQTGHECKTVACIAGWVVLAAGRDPARIKDVEDFASFQILGRGSNDMARFRQ